MARVIVKCISNIHVVCWLQLMSDVFVFYFILCINDSSCPTTHNYVFVWLAECKSLSPFATTYLANDFNPRPFDFYSMAIVSMKLLRSNQYFL